MTDRSEAARLKALHDYGVLDSAPEAAFDRLTALAADLFDAPIALVSLVDAERQWFKSRQGLEAAQTPRSQAFCAHALPLAEGSTLVVEDATADARFLANPLVTGELGIRFYAGAVLTGTDGHNLGTLCVIDTKTRVTPSATDLTRLQLLASIVVDELELRRAKRQADENRHLVDMAERMSGVGTGATVPTPVTSPGPTRSTGSMALSANSSIRPMRRLSISTSTGIASVSIRPSPKLFAPAAGSSSTPASTVRTAPCATCFARLTAFAAALVMSLGCMASSKM